MYLALSVAAAVVLLVLARELWLHFWLTGLAQAMRARGHREASMKLLQRIVATPSLFGVACAPNERFLLAWGYLEAGRPLDAATECRSILKHRRAPSIEANVRRRLADALEAAGEVEASTAERKRAEQLLTGATKDADYYLARGKQLADQRQYSQAAESYQTGLDLIPKGNTVARAETLVRLSLSCFHAGLLPEAVRAAEEALELKPTLSVKMTAHSAAAIGYSSQGLLEESERHHRAAYDVAISHQAQAQAARFLASLASNMRRRGKLLEAVQACSEATELSRGAWRMAGLTEGEALKSLGRFDQARAAFARAQRAEPFAVVAEEKRSQSTLALALALLEAESGQPEEADRWLSQSLPGFKSDLRLLLWVDAVQSWVLALQGRAAEATSLLAEVEQRRAEFAEDHASWEMVALMRARALMASENHKAASEAWETYLKGKIDPIDRVTGLHQLGLCRLRLGDAPGATAALEESVSQGIDSHDARQARHRLEELSRAEVSA